MANGIASSLAGLRAAGAFAGTEIRRGAFVEEEKELKAREKRLRRFNKGRGRGRLAGSILGALAAVALAPLTGGASLSLLGASALAGGGSFLGQLAGTAGTRGKKVGAGTFNVAEGRAQERAFGDISSLGNLGVAAGRDALSALLFKKILGSVGSGGKKGQTLAFGSDRQKIPASQELLRSLLDPSRRRLPMVQ